MKGDLGRRLGPVGSLRPVIRAKTGGAELGGAQGEMKAPVL